MLPKCVAFFYYITSPFLFESGPGFASNTDKSPRFFGAAASCRGVGPHGRTAWVVAGSGSGAHKQLSASRRSNNSSRNSRYRTSAIPAPAFANAAFFQSHAPLPSRLYLEVPNSIPTFHASATLKTFMGWGFSFLSCASATVCAHPLEVLRLRMQVERVVSSRVGAGAGGGGGGGVARLGFPSAGGGGRLDAFGTLRLIHGEGGVRNGLFAGLSPGIWRQLAYGMPRLVSASLPCLTACFLGLAWLDCYGQHRSAGQWHALQSALAASTTHTRPTPRGRWHALTGSNGRPQHRRRCSRCCASGTPARAPLPQTAAPRSGPQWPAWQGPVARSSHCGSHGRRCGPMARSSHWLVRPIPQISGAL